MKTKTDYTVGDIVRRVSNDYTNGRTGTIFEIDPFRQRARVNWDIGPRTWVRFSSLVIIS